MKGSSVSIITIGDEILIGQIVDTNSAWLGQKLNNLGLDVVEIITIRDKASEIVRVLSSAIQKSNLILITGGLGPTKDDLTKTTLAEYFGTTLKRNINVENWVRSLFERFGKEILDVNLQQADLPENCEVLWNELGTAPGMLFRKNGKIVVSMPGVPYEMKHIFVERLTPFLAKEFTASEIVHKTLMTAGIGESFIADKIHDIESSLPDFVKLAYLPRPGTVRLRLSARGTERKVLVEELEKASSLISERVGRNHYGYDEESLEEAIGKKLRERGETLVTAESCTGGNIAAMITSIAGSSDYFLGSVVSYSNQLKTEILKVQEKTLKEFGAVSEQVVLEMAEGMKSLTRASYSLSISGVAGPGGGTEEKPVGTVWICVKSEFKTKTRNLNFGGKREQIIERSSRLALYMLWTILIEASAKNNS